jgi:hypothetical protein
MPEFTAIPRPELLSRELVEYGFKPRTTDSCPFKETQSENITYVLVYVDNMLVAGTLADVQQVKRRLTQSFTVKDLGVAYHFLGFLISRSYTVMSSVFVCHRRSISKAQE